MSALSDSVEALRARLSPEGPPDVVKALSRQAHVMKARKKIVLVPIADLYVDPQYQRPQDREKTERFRREKRYRDPIEVNRRPDGSLWITDGQHRAFAAHADGLSHVPAEVTEVPQHREQERESGVMNHDGAAGTMAPVTS